MCSRRPSRGVYGSFDDRRMVCAGHSKIVVRRLYRRRSSCRRKSHGVCLALEARGLNFNASKTSTYQKSLGLSQFSKTYPLSTSLKTQRRGESPDFEYVMYMLQCSAQVFKRAGCHLKEGTFGAVNGPSKGHH